MSPNLTRLKPFAYLDTEKTPAYRAIMSVFMDAKAHFLIHLRSTEIAEFLHKITSFEGCQADDVQADLAQLCEWGNLKRTQDTSEVRTVEEFYRPRYLFQLTREGEAAERAVTAYEEEILRPGELQTAALGVIREQLNVLLNYAQQTTLDDDKVHVTFSTLKTYFDQLTSQAQIFIGSIQRAIDLHDFELEMFLAYKEKLIDYLQRFIGELVIATSEIANAMLQIEDTGASRLLQAIARRELVDSIDDSDKALEAAAEEWKRRWTGLKLWFISGGPSQSQADILRSRARSAIPALLIAVTGINDRRVASSDRPTDLRTLARWFARTDNDADARRLWRCAFALSPSRHLRIDDETAQLRDQQPVSSATSWLKSPPIVISPRLRKTGRRHRQGRPSNVIDRSADKQLLAKLAAEEAEQIESARQTLATGRQMRLSEIGELNQVEFELFLDLLGEALSAQRKAGEQIVTTSGDGTLEIELRPAGDGTVACIQTSQGEFRGRDHFVIITDLMLDGGNVGAERHDGPHVEEQERGFAGGRAHSSAPVAEAPVDRVPVESAPAETAASDWRDDRG